jgi:hypothetical protein
VADVLRENAKPIADVLVKEVAKPASEAYMGEREASGTGRVWQVPGVCASSSTSVRPVAWPLLSNSVLFCCVVHPRGFPSLHRKCSLCAFLLHAPYLLAEVVRSGDLADFSAEEGVRFFGEVRRQLVL